MTAPRFLQIHSLHSYTAALLNRDDSGQAKRLIYGGTSRTRISSQCLKRHWRLADDPYALSKLDGYVGSVRSRELVTEKVIAPLKDMSLSEGAQKALNDGFQKLVYGDKGAGEKKNRQTLLLGQPELDFFASEARRIAMESGDEIKKIEVAIGEIKKSPNFKTLRENTQLPGGLTAAMFGRMVTSDPAANIDAPIHVAHAFTVHPAETEGDYFTAVDDLKRDEDDGGADTIQETEITCGLFYGYVVIDMPALIKNCGGDGNLASRLVHNLTHLIAEVSPGAKLGSTAPYGRADLMLVEAGDRQPRSLATAFRKSLPHDTEAAITAMNTRLKSFDDTYETGEERRHACLDGSLEGVDKLSLKALSEWSASQVIAANVINDV